MPTPEELQQDQDFLKATPAEQIKYLSQTDADFAKAHPDEQAAYLAHITNQPMQEKPKAEPGTLSKIGSMVANRAGIPATPEDVSEAGSALGSDLGGMVKSIPSMIWKTSAPGMAVEGMKKGVTGMRALRSGQQTPEQQHEEEQKKAGYGTMYRKLATPLAEGIGVNVSGMEQSAKEGSPGGVMGHAAAVPTAIAATYGLGEIAPRMMRAIPSTARAGEALETVKRTAGGVPVDVNTPGQIALETQDLAGRGGMMPKVMRDYIRRTTAPNAPPLTYAEQRDFASNAGRLSADEFGRLTPVMQRQAARFAKSLGESNAAAAESAGQGANYRGGMKEYGQAARMNKRIEGVKDVAKQEIPKWLLRGAGAGAGYGLYRTLTK